MSSCSQATPTVPAGKTPSSPTQPSGEPEPDAPRSSGQLQDRLLTTADLGQGYTVKPARQAHHDDVTVVGCPALEKLGEAAATGRLGISRHASVSFTYRGEADSEVSEDLYSDSASKLSAEGQRIFAAMVSCPSYRVTVGSTPIEISTAKEVAPRLGKEQWSQTLAFTVGGRSSVLKQTAVRTGTVLVVVSGSPGLVDAHVHKAVRTARTAT
ncbi:hypothetical protein ADK70_38585 [Streptomyces rimosus subsp. pseudoverticillatus]|uniref:hypothetical protein n=1 Tax=Streptomyces rimosus TaxID=1927 RepID=UPI0006C3C2BD|nr:hypothetical protein [Streptomyces rimosus]KOT76399.1 hypothetical protein ADK70_38585 [Streptomyces rimosus subsp. pseudoverticillatus]